MTPGSPPASRHRKSLFLQNLDILEKQLAIEQKVKDGAEKMIKMYAHSKSSKDKKLHSEAQQMLGESRKKMEVLRMKIMRLRGQMESVTEGTEDGKSKMHTPGGRLALLRYRIDVETRVVQGVRKLMKAHQDKKAKATLSVSVHACAVVVLVGTYM